ncbi:FAD:protein FMN transferase [Niallia oryzisoli]|uniref:FAD:protein FMN transferase n=1 Tax=Niallia oryzisoli TaxID=1737571 RepID=A0ABZ2CD20_9BACI
MPIEQIASQWIIKKRDFSFDFGGFGKGYIVDKTIELFVKENVKNALVNAGGDLYAIGRHRVGIEHPLLQGKDMMRFYIEDLSLATSGKNFRKWSSNGRKYHHIVDGRTGDVADNGVLQASAIARTVMEAETISKVFCILPFEEATALVTKQFSNFAYFVYFDNSQMAVGGNSKLYSDLEVAV